MLGNRDLCSRMQCNCIFFRTFKVKFKIIYLDPKLVEFLKKRKREVQEQREAEKIKSLQNKPTPSGNDSQADTDVEAMDVVADDASCCNKDVSFN